MLLTREELQDRLIALHRASLELVKDVSLETLLERIASLACEQVGAKYAALGVLDEEGKLKQFITVGMAAEEMKQISHSPRGQGLIGALMHGDSGNIRIKEIADDPRSVGFPPGHAEMHSLLGVPIRIGGRQLGQIYLTEKVGDSGFNQDDEKIIEILAAYAGAAIDNARIYERLQEREATLTRRNDQLALLNEIGTALASSLELEDILNKTLALLMAHFQVEAGEIFLKEEDGETLRLVLHRGEAAEAFWTRNRFKIGEGMVGQAAERARCREVRRFRDCACGCGARSCGRYHGERDTESCIRERSGQELNRDLQTDRAEYEVTRCLRSYQRPSLSDKNMQMQPDERESTAGVPPMSSQP